MNDGKKYEDTLGARRKKLSDEIQEFERLLLKEIGATGRFFYRIPSWVITTRRQLWTRIEKLMETWRRH